MILVYHSPVTDTIDNNLLLIGCEWTYPAHKPGIFLNDPDPIYRNLNTLGSPTLFSHCWKMVKFLLVIIGVERMVQWDSW